MSRPKKGNRRERLRRLGTAGASFALLLAASFFLGPSSCSKQDPRNPLPVDCTADDQYDTEPVAGCDNWSKEKFEPSKGGPTWFGYGDSTPDASHSQQVDGGPFPIEAIPGGRCDESTTALVLRSQGHTDYGSGFGDYHPLDDAFSRGSAALYAANWEGISFWARAPGATDKIVIIALSDRTSDAAGGYCVTGTTRASALGAYAGSMQADASADDGGLTSAGASIAALVGPDSGTADSGVAPEKACDNYFQRTLTVTEDWRFYTLPFESFHQDLLPSRVPTGIDRSAIYRITARAPKEAKLELWIDDLGLYRKKGTAKPDLCAATPFCDPASCKLTSTTGTGGASSTGCTATGGTSSDGGCTEETDCTNVATLPTNPIVSNWNDVSPAPDNIFVSGGSWCCAIQTGVGWWEGFYGGPRWFPMPPDPCVDSGAPPDTNYLDGRVVDGTFNLTGNVLYFGGFLLWLEKCKIDMSEYAGLEMEIWGDVGPSNQLNFQVFTVGNSAPVACNPGKGTCLLGGDCKFPGAMIDVPRARGTTIKVRWTDLTGGYPEPGVNPKEVRQFQWSLNGTSTGQPYPVNVSIGTVSLFK